MGALFNILSHSIGSLVSGVLFTVIGTALLFLIIKGWRKDSTFTPLSYAVGGVLFFFLAFHAILICGALTIKGYCTDIEMYVNTLVAGFPDYTVFTQEDSQQILDKIRVEVPIVAYYLDWADFHGHTPENIAAAMADEMRSYMNWFILRRVGWSLLFIVIGAVFVIKTMEAEYQRKHDALRNARANWSAGRRSENVVGRRRKR